jgi:8-oxo-dGTP diphosphatase
MVTVTQGSGDGWVRLEDGRVFWGRFGAAGMLLRHREADGTARFLLAQRAAWVHRGNGMWSIPGGAIDRHEDPVTAAKREFEEEMGALPGGLTIVDVHVETVAPGIWSYHTCCADVAERPEYDRTLSLENDAARWVTLLEMEDLPLFEPFEAALPRLLSRFR